MPHRAPNPDWIETIVVVAIIALSALKPVATFLIRKFTPEKEPDRRDPRQAQRQTMHTPSALPQAKPLPPRSVPTPPQSRRRVVIRTEMRPRSSGPIPDPLRDILTQLVPELVPPRPVARQAPPVAKPSVHVQPPPAPKPPPRVETRATTSRKQDTHLTRPRNRAGARPHLTTADLPSKAEAAQWRREALDVLDAPHAAAADASTDPFSVVRLPSQQSLRVAVLMSELMGPPVALRDPSEHPRFNT
jgi:hypothetical protein